MDVNQISHLYMYTGKLRVALKAMEYFSGI